MTRAGCSMTYRANGNVYCARSSTAAWCASGCRGGEVGVDVQWLVEFVGTGEGVVQRIDPRDQLDGDRVPPRCDRHAGGMDDGAGPPLPVRTRVGENRAFSRQVPGEAPSGTTVRRHRPASAPFGIASAQASNHAWPRGA